MPTIGVGPLLLHPPGAYGGFLDSLLVERKNIQKTSLPKSIKISQNATLDAQGFNCDHFLMPFGLPFSINFHDRLILLNRDICNAKICFFANSGLPFWHKRSIKKSCVCKPPSWTAFFPIHFSYFFKWSSYRPRQNPVGSKIRRHRPVSGFVKQDNVESGQNLSLSGTAGL